MRSEEARRLSRRRARRPNHSKNLRLSFDSSSATPAGRLLVQFFLIPAFVVGVAVFVFWLFGALAVDRKTPAELLSDVRTGSRNQRWQAAFELTKKLPALTDPTEKAAFSAAAIKAFEGAENDDPRVRRYLTLVLGRLGDPRRSRSSRGALDDKDPETRLYALWALALDREPEVGRRGCGRSSSPRTPASGRRRRSRPDGWRTARPCPRSEKLLADPVTDVRWNAALALATLDDASGPRRPRRDVRSRSACARRPASRPSSRRTRSSTACAASSS